MTRIDIEIDGLQRDAIAVRFPYAPAAVANVKLISGARFVSRESGGPYWRVPLELETCHQLRRIFGAQLVVGSNLRAWAKDRTEKARLLANLADAEDAPLTRLPTVLPKLYETLRPYQRAGAAFAAHGQGVLIADEPGLGKTLEAIAGVAEAGLLRGAHLVVAPKTALKTVWERELAKWQPFPVISARGGHIELDDFLSEMDLHRGVWVVINPAKVRQDRYDWLQQVTWNTMIVDECHKESVRNTKTKTAKRLASLDGVKRIALSGTPMRNEPIDLFGILQWLDPTTHRSKWRWADQWCEIHDNGYGKDIGQIREDREEAFNAYLRPYVLRRLKSEVLPELPPKQYVDVWLDMEGEQLRQYREMERDAEAMLDDDTVSAAVKLAEYTRLKQFASAAHVVVDGKILPTIRSNKLEALVQLLDERGIMTGEGDAKVVVFSQFSSMVDMITEHLTFRGVRTLKITGDVTANKRDAAQDEFQSDGGARVLIMTTTAGGVAITLDRADTVVFIDETWSPDDQTQAEDRVHRASRMHNVTVYYLRSNDTGDGDENVEAYIRRLVAGKAETAERILDKPRRARKAAK